MSAYGVGNGWCQATHVNREHRSIAAIRNKVSSHVQPIGQRGRGHGIHGDGAQGTDFPQPEFPG